MNKLLELFGIDLRALGIFRICFALLLLADLAERAPDVVAFYTDWGVLPRKVVFNLLAPKQMMWTSPYYFSGGAWWVVTLMSINALFIMGLLVGYNTRLMTCLCWLFLVALQDRNTLILHGGDLLIRALLLWAIFLPWGATFSIDRMRAIPTDKPYPKQIISAATIGILLQVCLVYWSSGIFKWNAEWLNGKAVYYALNIDQFATSLGLALRQYTSLLPIFTYMVLFTELIGPFFAFSPWRTGPLRTCTVFVFMLMHVFFGLALKIDLFAETSIISWIPFLPTWFWDHASERMMKLNDLWKKSGVYCFFFQFVKEKVEPAPLILKCSWWENLLSYLLIIYLIIYNSTAPFPQLSQKLPRTFFKLGNFLHFEQYWGMFARPMKEDGWFVIPGKLLSGKTIDLFDGGKELSWEKPEVISDTFPNTRWIKLMQYLWSKRYEDYRLYYSQYLCRKWNSTHEGLEKLDTFEIYYMLNIIHDNYTKGPPQKILLWKHYCFIPETEKPLNKITTK